MIICAQHANFKWGPKIYTLNWNHLMNLLWNQFQISSIQFKMHAVSMMKNNNEKW